MSRRPEPKDSKEEQTAKTNNTNTTIFKPNGNPASLSYITAEDIISNEPDEKSVPGYGVRLLTS